MNKTLLYWSLWHVLMMETVTAFWIDCSLKFVASITMKVAGLGGASN